jgi:hypothetical protein
MSQGVCPLPVVMHLAIALVTYNCLVRITPVEAAAVKES